MSDKEKSIKKVVIFAGGKGTRLSELTEELPKPLIPIGGEPVILHIMRHFYRAGYKEFIVATGYKGDYFKSFFRDYCLFGRDVTFTKDSWEVHDSDEKEDWTVHVVDTGVESSTGQRLSKVRDYLGDEDFFLTYGDTVSNVPLHEVESQHYSNPKVATITAVPRAERFGILDVDGAGNVDKFREKSQSGRSFINGGFIACSNEILEHLNDSSGDFSFETLSDLSDQGSLGYYLHEGFWHAMDTKKDKDDLEKIYKEKGPSFTE